MDNGDQSFIHIIACEVLQARARTADGDELPVLTVLLQAMPKGGVGAAPLPPMVLTVEAATALSAALQAEVRVLGRCANGHPLH